MTEEDALLRAVIADPDDDAPRLIYADWLDEHGQGERAEFIRVQVALGGLDREDERLPELRRHERRLLRRHGARWAEPLGFNWGYRFRRGFVECLTLDANLFLSRGDGLFDLAPIRHLGLANAHQCVERLCQFPSLSRPICLHLSHTWLGDEDVRLLAGSASLRPLTGLDLSHNRIGGRGAISLARSPYLGSLDDLCLRGNAIPRKERTELRRRFGSRVQF